MTERAPIESPCVSVCRMSEDGSHCEGCYRTADEIAAWIRYTPDERRAIMDRLPARRESQARN